MLSSDGNKYYTFFVINSYLLKIANTPFSSYKLNAIYWRSQGYIHIHSVAYYYNHTLIYISHNVIHIHVGGAVCTFVWCFKRKNTWRSWHHICGSLTRYEKSLCSDNDPHCHSRKMKKICLDWISLLRRLLIVIKNILLHTNNLS